MPIDQRTLRPRPTVGAPPAGTFRLLLENSNTLTSEANAPLRTEQS
jgi:hypothetical protein